jgi:glycosyltransferase involved in cell wall biosynthesis
MLVATAEGALEHGFEAVVILREPVTPGNQYAQALAELGLTPVTPTAGAVARARALYCAVAGLGRLGFPLYMLTRRVSARRAWQRMGEEMAFWSKGALNRALDRALLRLLRREHRHRPLALIHAHRTDWAMPTVARWARAHQVPLICHYHGGFLLPEGLQQGPWPYSAEQVALIDGAEAFLALTQEVGASAERTFRPELEVMVLPNWLRAPAPPGPAAPDPENGTLRVGTACRIVEKKGPQTLVEAVAQLSQAGSDLHCCIMGDGAMRPELQDRARRLQIAPRVRLTGALSREQVQAVLTELDVFVLVSEEEGLPITLLEAMAARLPIVASPVGGIPDLVCDGENGFLVPVRDPAALAHALRVLAEDPALRRRMGEASRARYERGFSVEVAWPRLERLYHSLIAGAGGRSA